MIEPDMEFPGIISIELPITFSANCKVAIAEHDVAIAKHKDAVARPKDAVVKPEDAIANQKYVFAIPKLLKTGDYTVKEITKKLQLSWRIRNS